MGGMTIACPSGKGHCKTEARGCKVGVPKKEEEKTCNSQIGDKGNIPPHPLPPLIHFGKIHNIHIRVNFSHFRPNRSSHIGIHKQTNAQYNGLHNPIMESCVKKQRVIKGSYHIMPEYIIMLNHSSVGSVNTKPKLSFIWRNTVIHMKIANWDLQVLNMLIQKIWFFYLHISSTHTQYTRLNISVALNFKELKKKINHKTSLTKPELEEVN